MSVKVPRKPKAEVDTYKVKTVRKARSSASKPTANSNGKQPLAAYEHLHIGIVAASPDGRYMDVNEEFCRILGYPKKELLRLGIRDCTHEDDYAMDIRLHEQLVSGKIPFYELEKRYVRKDGQIIWVELTRSIVRDAKGKTLYTVGAVIDISDRKHVERVLRESAESLRLATEAARMFKWELDLEKQLFTFADNFEHVLGFSAGLLPQNNLETVLKLSPAEDIQAMWKAIDEAVENRSDLHSLQYRVINPEDGQTVWLEVNAKIVYSDDGRAQRIFGVAQNVTENRKAQEEIRTISTLPAENPHPTMRLTPEGSVLYANDPGLALLESWRQQGNRTIPDELQKCVTEVFASGVKQQIEMRQAEKIFACTLVPIRESGYVNFYGNDITERKQAEQELREYARQQAALYQLSDQLHHTNSLEAVYNAALDAILSGLQCERASILLHDDSGVMRFVAWRGLSDGYRKATEGHSPWNADEKNPYPICVSNIRTANLSASLKAVIQEEGIGALVFIPLLLNAKLIGKFMVYFNTPHDCSDVEIELGLMIARQLAAGIDQKRAEERLRESEERLRVTFDTAVVGFTTLTPDARFVEVNDAFCRIVGYTRAELLAMDCGALTHPFYLESTHEHVARLVKGEIPSFVLEKLYVRKDGVEIWVQNSVSLVRGADGQPLHLIAISQDITQRVQSEERLRASEALYRTIARSIPGGGVYVVDKDFRYLVAEGPVTDAFGLSRQMLEGHTVSEVFPDERGTRMEERLRRVFAGETISFETTHNGHVYWTQLAPLLDSIGQAIILTLDITERKQAEEALRQSEERFARFMQHLPGLAWIKDVQGRYIYANAAAEKAFKTPRQQLYGRTDPEVFPAEVAAQFKENDERALMDEKGVQVIETLLQDDGIVHHSLVSKFPIPGPDGRTALIGGTAFDVTERLQAEAALHDSEERLRAILSQATAGIVRKDAEGRLTFVNDAFCNMVGYSQAELLGKTIWELTHQEDIEENRRLFDHLMLEGVPFKLEKRLIRRDGSVIWVDVSVSPLMDAAGKPQSAVAVEVDITGRKQAEEALQQLNLQLESRVQKRTATIQAMNQTLRDEIAERKRIEAALRTSEAAARENEEKLRTLFDLLPVGISFLDPQGKVLQTNSALLDIVKLSKDELFHQAYKSRRYIHPDGTPMGTSEFASVRALTENRTIYNVETGIIVEDGGVIWTSVSAAPVDVADVGVVVVTVDITENKHAEQALQESHRRLQILSQRLVEVQEEERRALARELHDRVGQTLAALNINLIIINSQLSADVPQEISVRLNDSMKLVSETIALVRDVMTDLRPAVLDDYGLEAALESHISEFKSRYDIQVVVEKPDLPIPRLGPSVEMTFLRIVQEALMNIARHAQASEVLLSVRREAEAVCISVEDNGIGIDSWQHANRPGSHGLTIMRERAEAFGGTLKVRSVPGKGTRVEVSIPLAEDGQGEVSE